MTVTSAAMSTVRPMIDQYVGWVRMMRKLSRFQSWTIFVVNGSMDQNAVMSNSASEAR